MSPRSISPLRAVARLIAAGAPASAVEAELRLSDGSSRAGQDAPGADWQAIRVDQSPTGQTTLVQLDVVAGALSLDDLAALGEVEPLPSVFPGDPSSYLIVIDDPALPELCRVVASARDGVVTTLILQPDIRL
jgi:hypothetical protein